MTHELDFYDDISFITVETITEVLDIVFEE